MGICSSSSDDKKSKAKPRARKVLIIGAGFGGNGVVSGLTKSPNANDNDNNGVDVDVDVDVVMYDRKTSMTIGASWQFFWSSRIPDNKIPEWNLHDLQNLQAAKNQDQDQGGQDKQHFVKLLTGDKAAIQRIDTEAQRVMTNGNFWVPYDTLVLSPGVVSDASLVNGLKDSNALDICNIKHVPVIKERIDALLQDAKTSSSPKTILVCVTKMPYKCPPVPFEVASILDDLRRERGVKDQVRIILSVPVPFPFAGPPAAKLFKTLLQEQDIEYWPNHVVQKVVENTTSNGTDDDNNDKKKKKNDQQSTTTVHYKLIGDENGGDDETKTLTVDLALCTFPQRAPDFCKPLCNAEGFIDVDLQTNLVRSLQKPNTNNNVYAIGDACHTMFPKPNKPHPKAGEFAYLMGLHVADQILASVQGREAPPPPQRKASCVAECGVDGKGVNIQPNFTNVLADPANGMPKFEFPIVEDASAGKLTWINDYLTKFFGKDKFTKFGSK